jgi:hypothetical protein
MQACSITQLAVFGFVLYLLIDVNERIRRSIYTCDSQIASGSVAFQLVIYINSYPGRTKIASRYTISNPRRMCPRNWLGVIPKYVFKWGGGVYFKMTQNFTVGEGGNGV